MYPSVTAVIPGDNHTLTVFFDNGMLRNPAW